MNASKWKKTRFANLVRYEPNGIFFARAKVRGRLIRKSLETISFEVAKTKLDELLTQERARALVFTGKQVDRMTFGNALAKYKEHVETHPKLKPTSKKARLATADLLERDQAGWIDRKVASITRADCKDAARIARKEFSNSFFNSWLIVLRAVFEVAINAGARLDNPAKPKHRELDVEIEFAARTEKELNLPSTDGFRAMLDNLERNYRRRRASVTIRFLAFSGMRINEARQMTPANVNLDRGEFVLPASICKNGKERRVPIIPEMRPLLVKLLNEYPGQGSLIPVKNPKEALRAVCKELNIQRLTNHDLRHFFATRCIESGVDVKTLATWLGHEDGGALLLKRYAHLRNEHSKEMAAKVNFGTADAGTKIVPMTKAA